MATTAAKKKPGPKAKPLPPATPKSRPKGITSKKLIADKLANQEKNFAKLRAKAATVGDPANINSAKNIALRKDDRPLTEMQMMFVRHWAAGESILSASARAGYKDGGTYGYRLSKDPAVLKIYEREKALYAASCQMTRKRVMEGFIAAAEMAQLQADPTSMTGAWREIGKMCGFYEPKKIDVNVNVNGTITSKVERLSDDMLLRLIKGEVGSEVFEQDMAEVPDTPFKELSA